MKIPRRGGNDGRKEKNMVEYNKLIIGFILFGVGSFWCEFPPKLCMSRYALFRNKFLRYLPIFVFIICAAVAIYINWSNLCLLWQFLTTTTV